MRNVDIFIFLLLLAIIWYWRDGMRAKELARRVSQKACQDADVIFLDDTVALKKIRLCRSPAGQMTLLREYRFEFASDGVWRYYGYVSLLGRQVSQVDMEAHRER